MLFIFWLVLNVIFLFSSLYFYLLYFASGVSLLNIYSCFVFLKIVIFTQWTKQFISSCVMIADEFEFIYTVFVPSLLAQMVQCLPTMQETWIRSLLGKILWRKKWQRTPVALPGKRHGWRSVVDYKHGVPKSPTRLSDFTFTFIQYLTF